MVLYGSFVTNITVDTSDIDIRIMFKTNIENKEFYLNLLLRLLEDSKLFDKITNIPKATIPVIKLVFFNLTVGSRLREAFPWTI